MMTLQHKLPVKIYEILERADLATPKQIITKSTWDIKMATNLKTDDVRMIKNVVANCYNSLSLTGDKLLQKDAEIMRISLGCSSLDNLLCGGIRRGTITELYGASGSGKTQIGIQAALHNWPSGTVYICTEDLFPVKRYEQIKTSLPDPETDRGKNIFVEHVTESHELLACVRVRLPKLLKSNYVSLIVLDSVAAPFRTESTNYVQRAEELRELAMHLTAAAQENNLAVLCINQVTGTIEDVGDNIVPSLGLAWSNLVNTRLWLRKTMRYVSSVSQDECSQLQVRELAVIFAPDTAYSTADCVITCKGLQSV